MSYDSIRLRHATTLVRLRSDALPVARRAPGSGCHSRRKIHAASVQAQRIISRCRRRQRFHEARPAVRPRRPRLDRRYDRVQLPVCRRLSERGRSIVERLDCMTLERQPASGRSPCNAHRRRAAAGGFFFHARHRTTSVSRRKELSDSMLPTLDHLGSAPASARSIRRAARAAQGLDCLLHRLTLLRGRREVGTDLLHQRRLSPGPP